MTSREIVTDCLNFDKPSRIPRHMWILPWGEIHYRDELNEVQQQFPDDIIFAPDVNDLFCVQGDLYSKGRYIDEWGCEFQNLQNGIIGEVRDPVIPHISEWGSFNPPYRILPKFEQEPRIEGT